MGKDEPKSGRPRRTRQHIIASLSRNYVERFILAKGHTVERRSDDYGFDLDMETYDGDGYIENGMIRIQLKATDRLEKLKLGDAVGYDIEMRHYELWIDEPGPVFLILYDARRKTAYWLHLQDYFAADPSRRPRRDAKTLRVHIPLANEFTEDTVDEMRARKAKNVVKVPQKERYRG